MNTILKFEDYINELWSKGLERAKTNKERLGDIKTPADKVCEFASKMMFEYITNTLHKKCDDNTCHVNYVKEEDNTIGYIVNIINEVCTTSVLVKVSPNHDDKQFARQLSISFEKLTKIFRIDNEERDMLNYVIDKLEDEYDIYF